MRLTVGIAAAMCSAAAIGQPFDFKGDALGESLETWRERHEPVAPEGPKAQQHVPVCSDTGPSNSVLRPQTEGVGAVYCELQNLPTTIAGVEALVIFMFNTDADGHATGNGLRTISISFESARYETVAAALIDVYGMPNETSTEFVQNRLGATFENRLSTWSRDATRIALQRYTRSLDRSFVAFVHLDLQSEHERRIGASPAPGADDL